jgi:predicted alpha/beta-hydrolase family hydrolase
MPPRRPSPAPDPAGERHPVPLATGQSTTATVYRAGAPRGRLLLLAHGAGAGQHHPFMTAMAAQLAARGLDVVTFDFSYLHERRKVPDRAPALEACFANVIDWATARREFSGHRLLIGGKSMGGRMATHLAAADLVAHDGAGPPLSGVVALGYPLHPPGKPQQLRSAHLTAIRTPLLIVQGSRDTFGTPDELRPVIETMPGPVTLHVVAGGDHSFTVARSPRDGVLSAVADIVAGWADSSNL